MSKFLKSLSLVILVFIFTILSNFIFSKSKYALAQEKGLDWNKIRFSASYNIAYNPIWQEFGFVESGDNSVKLRPIVNGEPVHYSKYPDHIRFEKPFTIKILNEEGKAYVEYTYFAADYVKDLAILLESYNLRYGLDSIQIIPIYENNPFTITGNVSTVQSKVNYSSFISKKDGRDTSFRVEKDGLYAQYVHQVVIPDGEYVIETASNFNKLVTLEDTRSVLTRQFHGDKNQKFYFKYDKNKRAYKIMSQRDGSLLSWDEKSGADVFTYPDQSSNDQYWYVQNTSSDRIYRIVNASNPSKILNLDSNGLNISVANPRGDNRQEFRIKKSSDKLNFLEGQWQISSKLDHNKVLNLDNSNWNLNVYYNYYGNNQKWKFEYNPAQDAYIIRSVENPKLSLVYDVFGNSNNVYAKYSNASDMNYWQLEELSDGHFIIKSLYNGDIVMDVTNSDPSNGSNVQGFTKHGSNNQQFKFLKAN